MILIIIFGVLVVAGIICTIIYCREDDMIACVAAIFGDIIGGLGLLVLGIVGIVQNNPVMRMKARQQYEQSVLELNTTYEQLMTYADESTSVAVVQYNERVREFKTEIIVIKKKLQNPWINLLECCEYANFDENAVKYFGE